MALTLAQLRLVRAINDRGSLGKASTALGVTQPALSRSLKELERQLGVELFERLPSGLRPTRFCSALLPHAANAVEEADRGLEEVRVLAGESQEVVRVGAISGLTPSLLPALVVELMNEIPNARIKVIEGVDEVLTAALLAREVDVIISGPMPENDEIARVVDLGFGDVCSLLVGERHPFLGRDDVTIDELFGQPWVAPPTDAMPRKIFDQLMRAVGREPPAMKVETRSVDLIRSLVAHQGFMTWGASSLYCHRGAGSPIYPLDLPAFRLQPPFFVYRMRRAAVSVTLKRMLLILQRLGNTHSVDPIYAGDAWTPSRPAIGLAVRPKVHGGID